MRMMLILNLIILQLRSMHRVIQVHSLTIGLPGTICAVGQGMVAVHSDLE